MYSCLDMEISGYNHFLRKLGVYTWNLTNLDIRVNKQTLLYEYITNNNLSYDMIIVDLFFISTCTILGGYIWTLLIVAIYTLAGTYLNWRVRSWLIRYVRVVYAVFIYWKVKILNRSWLYGGVGLGRPSFPLSALIVEWLSNLRVGKNIVILHVI